MLPDQLGTGGGGRVDTSLCSDMNFRRVRTDSNKIGIGVGAVRGHRRGHDQCVEAAESDRVSREIKEGDVGRGDDHVRNECA